MTKEDAYAVTRLLVVSYYRGESCSVCLVTFLRCYQDADFTDKSILRRSFASGQDACSWNQVNSKARRLGSSRAWLWRITDF